MIQEADHGTTSLAMQGSSGRYQGDETLLVRFFTHPRLSQGKSSEAGRPIYVDTPYIQIMQPGNKDNIIQRPATEMDKARFPEHFRKYEIREDQDAIEGTMLEEWAGVTRSQCEELRFLNIRTVEQLAAVSDVNAQGVMGISMLKAKAEKFLESSKESAIADKFAEMQAKYDALVAKVEADAAPKPRGRPPKSKEEKADA